MSFACTSQAFNIPRTHLLGKSILRADRSIEYVFYRTVLDTALLDNESWIHQSLIGQSSLHEFIPRVLAAHRRPRLGKSRRKSGKSLAAGRGRAGLDWLFVASVGTKEEGACPVEGSGDTAGLLGGDRYSAG